MMTELKDLNMLIGTLCQIDVSIKVDAENHLPYEIRYKITFADTRFKSFVKNFNQYLCFSPSGFSPKLHIVEEKDLSKKFIKHYIKIPQELDITGSYRVKKEEDALKFARQLEALLEVDLNYKSSAFNRLIDEEKKYNHHIRESIYIH